MNLLSELRLAVRTLLRKPGFASVAILTCALAVGACTSVYTIVYGVLLQPLPYPQPDQLVQVWQLGKSGGHTQFSDPNFEDLRDQTHAFAAFAQYADGVTTVVAGDQPLRAHVAAVSAQFFDVFGTPALVGRFFQPNECHEGAMPVAVVSYGFWKRALGGAADPTTVPIRIGTRTYAAIGVLPPQFSFPAGTDIWTPREQDSRNPYRTGHNWEAVARLSSSLSPAAARADASTVAKNLKTKLGNDTAMSDVALVPLKEELTGAVERSLVVLMVAVACLLAIACANLTNLLLVHLASRRRELAVRSALGASRGVLALPVLAEIIVIALAGGVLGLGIAALGPRALLAFGPPNLPRAGEIGISVPVVIFSIGTTTLVALGLGLTAAWRAGSGDIVDTLRQGQRGQAGSRAASRLRNGLVVIELAASLVLLVGAGLLGRSLMQLLNENPGFRTEGVVTIDLSNTPGSAPEARTRLAQFHESVIERLSALPGVVAAGGINRLPMGTSYANGTFIMGDGIDQLTDMNALGKLFLDPKRTGSAEFRVASARYFDAMGIPLLAGRVFQSGDTVDAPHVAVISDSLAKRTWPGRDPVGQRVQFGNMDGDLRVFTVVGVVGDIHERGLDAKPRPTFYADYRQRPRPTADFSVVIRTAGPADALSSAALRAVHALDPTQAPRVRTIDQIVAASVSDRRFTAIVIGAFAVSALLLAIVGIYGVLSYAVSQRLPEFGLRLALGAQRSHVWRMVLRQAGVLVVAGSGAGLLVAWLSTRLLQSLLFGITATDPATFALVTVTLAVTSLLACAWPALRATRVNPLTALRSE